MSAVWLVGASHATEHVRSVLNRSGKPFRTEIVRSANEAADRLEREPVDWLNCDLDDVGREAGVELLHHFRNLRPDAECLAILSPLSLCLVASRLEGIPFLLKPLTPAKIIATANYVQLRLMLRRPAPSGRKAARGADDAAHGADDAAPGADDAALHRIMAFIEEHLEENVTREDIARHVHFHPAYLSRFFKKRTGLSLSEYMVAQRIERAKTLLIEPKLSVGHIVNRLGYDNSSHFSRTFKKMTGYTPLQFRKLYGNGKKQGSLGPFAGPRHDPLN